MGGGVERMEEDPPGSPGPPTLEDQHGMEVIHPVTKSAKTIQNEIRQRYNSPFDLLLLGFYTRFSFTLIKSCSQLAYISPFIKSPPLPLD